MLLDASLDSACVPRRAERKGDAVLLASGGSRADSVATTSELGEQQRSELASVIQRIESLKRRAAAACARASAADSCARARAAELTVVRQDLDAKNARLAATLAQLRTAMRERDAREADMAALFSSQSARAHALIKLATAEADAHAAEATGVRELLGAREKAHVESDARRVAELRLLQIELCASETQAAPAQRIGVAIAPAVTAVPTRAVRSTTAIAVPPLGVVRMPSAMCVELDSILLEGWCLKRSRWLRAWRKRWLVLLSEDGGRSFALLSLKQQPRAHGGVSLRALATERVPVDALVSASTVSLTAADLASVDEQRTADSASTAICVQHPSVTGLVLAGFGPHSAEQWLHAIANAAHAARARNGALREHRGAAETAEWLGAASLFGSPSRPQDRLAQLATSTPPRRAAREPLAELSVASCGGSGRAAARTPVGQTPSSPCSSLAALKLSPSAPTPPPRPPARGGYGSARLAHDVRASPVRRVVACVE